MGKLCFELYGVGTWIYYFYIQYMVCCLKDIISILPFWVFVLQQYECLVEGCGMKFNTDRARHRHLVDKHKFPMSFEFHKRRHPSKRQRQRQRLRARHSSNTGETPLDKENMEVEKNIDALASAVSNLTTEDSTPTVVTFGRRHNRAFGFVPHSLHRKTS